MQNMMQVVEGLILVIDILLDVCLVVLSYGFEICYCYIDELCKYVEWVLLMVDVLFSDVGISLKQLDVIVFVWGFGLFIGLCIVVGVV